MVPQSQLKDSRNRFHGPFLRLKVPTIMLYLANVVCQLK